MPVYAGTVRYEIAARGKILLFLSDAVYTAATMVAYAGFSLSPHDNPSPGSLERIRQLPRAPARRQDFFLTISTFGSKKLPSTAPIPVPVQ